MLLSDPAALGRVILVGVLAYVALVTIALGSSLATALLSTSTSLSPGVIGFVVLIALQFAVTWLAVRSGRFEHWLKAWHIQRHSANGILNVCAAPSEDLPHEREASPYRARPARCRGTTVPEAVTVASSGPRSTTSMRRSDWLTEGLRK
jgi:hypothetical protein